MRLKFFLALTVFTLLISACGQATPAPQPFSMTDARGKAFNFDQPVQKIISLAPANTEILFAIGAGKQVVGRDSLSDYPEEAKTVADIGGGFGALNTEIILAAKPDFILAGDLTPAEQIKSLEDLGLTVFVLGNPTDLAGMYKNLILMAQITGHESETAKMVASLQAREKTINDKLAGITERPLVLYELDGTDPNAPWVPGPGTFVDTLIKRRRREPGRITGRRVGTGFSRNAGAKRPRAHPPRRLHLGRRHAGDGGGAQWLGCPDSCQTEQSLYF